MEEVINKLKLEDVSGGFDCGLKNYGCMREAIGHFYYEFKSGIYILEGECATGGWALSTVLAGKDNTYDGEVWFNDKKVNCKQINKLSCYVGEDAGLRKRFGLVPMTVKEQIEYGINRNLSFNNDIQKIKSSFGLSEERFDRPMKYVSGERWRISMAIGYALGKIIYCFPWMNKKNIIRLEDCLKLCFNALLEIGAIIIIPTTSHHVIKKITDKYTVIEMD